MYGHVAGHDIFKCLKNVVGTTLPGGSSAWGSMPEFKGIGTLGPWQAKMS